MYCKEPSKYFVDYSTLVDDLWKDTSSDDEDEDKVIKRTETETIANFSLGLFEELGSTDIKSMPFKTLEEALHSQEFGRKLSKFEMKRLKQRTLKMQMKKIIYIYILIY